MYAGDLRISLLCSELFLPAQTQNSGLFRSLGNIQVSKSVQPILHAPLHMPSSIFSLSHWELIFPVIQTHNIDFLPRLWIHMFVLILSLNFYDSVCICKIDLFCPSTQIRFFIQVPTISQLLQHRISNTLVT